MGDHPHGTFSVKPFLTIAVRRSIVAPVIRWICSYSSWQIGRSISSLHRRWLETNALGSGPRLDELAHHKIVIPVGLLRGHVSSLFEGLRCAHFYLFPFVPAVNWFLLPYFNEQLAVFFLFPSFLFLASLASVLFIVSG